MKYILILFTLLFFSCSQKQQRIVKKENDLKTEKKDNTNQISDKDGGPGFEKIAKSLGYKTSLGTDYGNPDAKKGGVFHTFFASEPATYRAYGPQVGTSIVRKIVTLVYDSPILNYDYKLNKFSRGLADYWKFSEDGKTAWFRINPKVRFSDGEPLTVDDIIASFDLATSKETQDVYASYKKGYKLEKVSKHILKVSIDNYRWKAWIDFSLYILPKKYLSKVDNRTYISKYNKDFMPGLGPYVFDKEKSKEGEILMFSKNKDWWGYSYNENKNLYNFDNVSYKILRNKNLQKESFKKGQIDRYEPTSDEWYDDFRKQDASLDPLKRNLMIKRVLFLNSMKNTYSIFFNTRIKPIDNINVRKAIAYAFNRDLIIEKILHKDYVKYNTQFPLSNYASKNLPDIKYAPEKAKELLDEAGFNIIDEDGVRKNEQGQRLEFPVKFIKELDISEKSNIQLQQDLQKVGIKINLEAVDFPGMVKSLMDDRDFSLTLMRFSSDIIPTPRAQFHSSLSDITGTFNVFKFKNKQADELIESYESEKEPQKRYEELQKLDEIITNKFVNVSLWIAPFSLRYITWNKFGFGSSYISEEPVEYWYLDPNKENKLEEAKENKNIKLEEGKVLVDNFNLKPSDFKMDAY